MTDDVDPLSAGSALPATSAALMGSGTDDVAFPSGFTERRAPWLWEVSFRDRDSWRFTLPILATMFAFPLSAFLALASPWAAFVVCIALAVLWVRAVFSRIRIAVDHGVVTSVRRPLGLPQSVPKDELAEVAVHDDPWAVVVLDKRGRVHRLAQGLTEKQARVIASRIKRALER